MRLTDILKENVRGAVENFLDKFLSELSAPLRAFMATSYLNNPETRDWWVNLETGLLYYRIHGVDDYIPMCSGFYGLYSHHYHMDILTLKTEGPYTDGYAPFTYPLLNVGLDNHDFETFMKNHKMYKSHMLGKKSTEVVWKYEGTPEGVARIRDENIDLFLMQKARLEHQCKAPLYQKTTELEQLYHPPEYLDGAGIVYATYVKTGEVIAVMLTQIENYTVNCRYIGLSVDAEHKKYSLASCAHLAVLREYYEKGFQSNVLDVNYGINVTLEGDTPIDTYKKYFATLETPQSLKL